MDDDLFQRILWNENHILHALLPDRRPNLTYELGPRSHNRKLAVKLSCLTEKNCTITVTNISSLFHFIRPTEFFTEISHHQSSPLFLSVILTTPMLC